MHFNQIDTQNHVCILKTIVGLISGRNHEIGPKCQLLVKCKVTSILDISQSHYWKSNKNVIDIIKHIKQGPLL